MPGSRYGAMQRTGPNRNGLSISGLSCCDLSHPESEPGPASRRKAPVVRAPIRWRRSADPGEMKISTAATVLLAMIAWDLTAPRPAHAYIDPVSGSVVLQILAAGMLAAVFMIKLLWASIVDAARRLRERIGI